jgi:hypothetical protein
VAPDRLNLTTQFEITDDYHAVVMKEKIRIVLQHVISPSS